MATVALIQQRFRVLNQPSDEGLHGLELQVWENFYESLEEAYNHDIYTAETLAAYQDAGSPPPEVIICVPFAEDENPAKGLDEIRQLQAAYPGVPVIAWSTRTESSLRRTCLEELGCAGYYTGTQLTAPEDLPGLIADALG